MIYTLTSDIFDIFTMNIFFNTIFQKIIFMQKILTFINHGGIISA